MHLYNSPQVNRDNMLKAIRVLERNTYDRTSKEGAENFDNALKWIQSMPSAGSSSDVSLRNQLMTAFCRSFNISDTDLILLLEGHTFQERVEVDEEEELLTLLPDQGYFHQYIEYTAYNEAPLIYHVFSAISALGASLGRRLHLDQGPFKIYPNYCIILVGATAVKKNTAMDFAASLLKDLGVCPIIRDSSTIQALFQELRDNGHALIYIPEMVTFFGRESYNVSLIPHMLRLLDCPDFVEYRTQSRGLETIPDPAVTLMGGSTPSLMSENANSTVCSGGFLNRVLPIYAERSNRCFPRSRFGKYSEELKRHILRVSKFDGIIDLNNVASDMYDSWYEKHWRFIREQDESYAQLLGRSANHLLRTAMLIHLVQCDDKAICHSCMKTAIDLLAFVERKMPFMLRTLRSVNANQDLEFVFNVFRKNKGIMGHSALVRATQSRMNSSVLKGYLNTLIDSGRIIMKEKGAAKYYFIPSSEETQ